VIRGAIFFRYWLLVIGYWLLGRDSLGRDSFVVGYLLFDKIKIANNQ
jgi:hypothetical protein